MASSEFKSSQECSSNPLAAVYFGLFSRSPSLITFYFYPSLPCHLLMFKVRLVQANKKCCATSFEKSNLTGLFIFKSVLISGLGFFLTRVRERYI